MTMAQTSGKSRTGQLIAEGVMAGILGALVLAALMVAAHGTDRLWTALKLAAYPFLGDRVMRPAFDARAVLLGVACHLAVGIVWGVLFALLVDGFSRTATVLLGAFWGVVVWLVMFVAVVPLLAPPLAEGGGAIGNLFMHVVFGLSLGIGVASLRPHVAHEHRYSDPRKTPSGQAA
jgi:hypothetical protein